MGNQSEEEGVTVAWIDECDPAPFTPERWDAMARSFSPAEVDEVRPCSCGHSAEDHDGACSRCECARFVEQPKDGGW